jgi:hypothetical protein
MMSIEDVLQVFPAKRIKPNDGLAVTADIWEEAHEYHRQHLRLHNLLQHGQGIVTGLEVIASDPPDTSVYILPGVAVDSAGQIIVLPQPVAYDIGDELEGLLYLLLSYGESRPKAGGAGEGTPLYVQAEFSIAARTLLPNTPWVELARIRRRSRKDAFVNAKNSAQPGPNEIDLRFRREVGAPREVSVAVCYLGGETGEARDATLKHGRGAIYLARALGHMGDYQVVVHDDLPLAPGIETNTLIYLVGHGEFELSSGQVNGLSNFVNRGRGTLLIESSDSAAEATFLNLLAGMEMEPVALSPGHRLLMGPHLFAAPPPGFEAEEVPRVLVRGGVIFSTGNYGLVWQGEIQDGVPSREQLRSATEWGANIIAYARRRRRA